MIYQSAEDIEELQVRAEDDGTVFASAAKGSKVTKSKAHVCGFQFVPGNAASVKNAKALIAALQDFLKREG